MKTIAVGNGKYIKKRKHIYGMKKTYSVSLEMNGITEAKNFGLTNLSAFIDTHIVVFNTEQRARAYEREHGIPKTIYCTCGASYSSILQNCPQCKTSSKFAMLSAEQKIRTMRL